MSSVDYLRNKFSHQLQFLDDIEPLLIQFMDQVRKHRLPIKIFSQVCRGTKYLVDRTLVQDPSQPSSTAVQDTGTIPSLPTLSFFSTPAEGSHSGTLISMPACECLALRAFCFLLRKVSMRTKALDPLLLPSEASEPAYINSVELPESEATEPAHINAVELPEEVWHIITRFLNPC